jgi:transposase
MRPSPDEHTCTTASNDANPCAIVRKRIHRIYLTAPLVPKRGPKCKLGYHRLFNLILWVLYTGMQWKCLPIPHDAQGKAAIHYTTVYRAFAKWADDGSLWQAFIASVRHLATERHLDTSVLHGDGTNTVAKKGAMALATRAINTKRARKLSPSRTPMATF